MNRQGPVLFEAPLVHEHASHCNCRECRSISAQAFAPGWAESEWEATATKNVIYGLDTASAGGPRNPNWVRAKAEGAISFAIIRANEGIWEDRFFKGNWPKIKDAGIVRGAYLFLRFPHPKHSMKAPDPVAQAKAFINTVGPLQESDLPPSLDVEFPGDKRYPHRSGRELTGMTAEQLLDGVRTAWKVLKAYYRVAPIIYTSARVWQEDLHNLPARDLVESPLWLARYPFKSGPVRWGPFAGGPPVPPPWGGRRDPAPRLSFSRQRGYEPLQHDAEGRDRRPCEVGPDPARHRKQRPVRRRYGECLAHFPGQEGTRVEWRRRPADFRVPLLADLVWSAGPNAKDVLPGFPTGKVDMNRFNTMLKGEIGSRVKWVQRRLGIAQSGWFDAALESALRAFQDNKGLVLSGVVGLQTFAHLCWLTL